MSTEESDADPLSQAAQADWFLQSLVSMVNGSDVEIGITLQVGGMLVSGSLVSGAKYFAGVAADFSRPFARDPEAAESIRNNLAKYGEIYRGGQESEEIPPPQFIHLKNARFFNTAGNPIPGNKAVWWRGRISEVGGFVRGSLLAEEG